MISFTRAARITSHWRGRMLFSRRGMLDQALDWALAALWVLALLIAGVLVAA